MRTDLYAPAGTTVVLRDSTPPPMSRAVLSGAEETRRRGAQLPRGVIGPMVNDEYSDVTFALYALKAQASLIGASSAKRRSCANACCTCPGVKKVNIIGEQAERIFVEFSYDRLATLGVSPRDIFAALNSRNAMTPAGSIDQGPASLHPAGRRHRRSAGDPQYPGRRARPR